jgi:hypothetical protein
MASGLEGVAELSRQLSGLGAAFSVPILRAAVRAGMKPAQTRWIDTIWRGNTAHRTYKGRLVAPGFSSRNTRIVTRAEPGGTRVSAALGVRKEAFYAVQFIERELGNSKHTAQPSLRAAMSSTINEQQAALAAKLRDRIDKLVPKR